MAIPTVQVSLPAALFQRSGQRQTVSVSGQTVREAIEALDRAFPGMRFNLCFETGEVRRYVNIFINGQHIRYLQGLDTPLADGMKLYILPSVAGG